MFFFRIALSVAAGMVALSGAALAQSKSSLTLGVTLEPPHLDPTAGAAAAPSPGRRRRQPRRGAAWLRSSVRV